MSKFYKESMRLRKDSGQLTNKKIPTQEQNSRILYIFHYSGYSDQKRSIESTSWY